MSTMSQTIVITGGTGLVGSYLTKLLLEAGHQVRHLSRTTAVGSPIPTYRWDIAKQEIDEAALKHVDAIIHLAGASVADKAWSKERKQEIMESRTKSTTLLKQVLAKGDHKVKAFVSASAIGYYGWDSGGVWKKEDSRFGDDFLATVTKAWEEEVNALQPVVPRIAKLRIGLVLSAHGGALPAMVKPIKIGLGAPLAGGDQYMSWIHIHDLCRMFMYAVLNEDVAGIYNAVAPEPLTNREFTRQIADVLKKPLILPRVPAFMLRLLLGERSSMLIGGSRVSAEKIQEAGFTFDYQSLESALKNLLAK